MKKEHAVAFALAVFRDLDRLRRLEMSFPLYAEGRDAWIEGAAQVIQDTDAILSLPLCHKCGYAIGRDEAAGVGNGGELLHIACWEPPSPQEVAAEASRADALLRYHRLGPYNHPA